jgi:DNA mismatch repair protein MutS
MLECAHIIEHATPNSLVLMDEVGRGTSTFDGQALAYAIAKQIATKNLSYCVFATHYFELADLVHECQNVANIHVVAKKQGSELVFLYNIRQGFAEKSFGIEVAKLAGMNLGVIALARKKLIELEQHNLQNQQQNNTVFDDNFDIQAQQNRLIKEIQALPIEQMTPLDALEKLQELQEIFKKETV